VSGGSFMRKERKLDFLIRVAPLTLKICSSKKKKIGNKILEVINNECCNGGKY
jgi:hypothetical protein